MNTLRRSSALVLAAALVAAAGCENPFETEPTPVPGAQSYVLHDFRQGPLVEPSAFDVFSASVVRTDQANAWDFLFFVTAEDAPEFRPREVVIGEESTAGIQQVEETFADFLEVPEEGYTTDAPVPVEAGAVYAVRSRRSGGCTHYGKVLVDSMDVDGGRVFFTAVVNPNCNRRSVEPSETDTTDTNQGDEGT